MNIKQNGYHLTPKEIEVIKLLSTGKMYKEIATIQNVKLDTVKNMLPLFIKNWAFETKLKR